MSKGSARRPAQVDRATLDRNWRRTFGHVRPRSTGGPVPRNAKRRDGGDLFAVDSHGETKPAHRIAGGVVFATEVDVAPMSRARGRGKSVAESRGPTAKPLPSKGFRRKKSGSLSRQMLDHVNAKGNPTRD